MTPVTRVIVEALGKGPIRAFGGLLCDVNMQTLRGLVPVDIHNAKPEMAKHGIRVERLDSGGSPTWGLAK